MNLHRSAFSVLAAAALAATSAFAGDFAATTPQQLARHASDVVLARVVSVRTEMGPLPGVAGEVPVRRVSIEVIEAWRGAAKSGERLDVLVPGGTAPDGSALMVSTSPSTDDLEGREIVAFVRRDALGAGRNAFDSGWLGLHRVATRRTSSGALERTLLGNAGSAFPDDVPLPKVRDVVQAVPAERGR
jgi:hypothetical protein